MFAKMDMATGFKPSIVLKCRGVKVYFVAKLFRFIGDGCPAIFAKVSAYIGAAFVVGWGFTGPAPLAIGHAKIGSDGRCGVQSTAFAVAIGSPKWLAAAFIGDCAAQAPAFCCDRPAQ